MEESEAERFSSIFEAAGRAYSLLGDAPEDGAKRRAVSLELTRELEAFLQAHPDSAWAPDLNLRLGLAAQLRSSYTKAVEHFAAAWEATKNSPHNPAGQIALEAAGGLAKLLALIARNDVLARTARPGLRPGKPVSPQPAAFSSAVCCGLQEARQALRRPYGRRR